MADKKVCKDHKWHLVRVEYPILDMPDGFAVFVCENCGLLKKVKVHERKED